MPEIPFKIFPSNGYINSQFQLIRFDSNCRKITIEKAGAVVKTVVLSQEKYATLTEFNEAGVYEAKTILNGKNYSQIIEIKNSIRLGTSELKSVFTFDEIPYSFLLMKDRMLIYDEHNKYLVTENNISPSEIKKINATHILLKTELKNKKDKIVNYAIFSLNSFNAIWELKNKYKEISVKNNEDLLWVHNFFEKELICFSLTEIGQNGPKEILKIALTSEFKRLDYGDYLYIEEKDSILIIDLAKARTITVEKLINSALDKQGNSYLLQGDFLHSKSLLSKVIVELKYKLLFKLNLSPENFLFIGKELTVDESNDFDINVQDLIEKNRPIEKEGTANYKNVLLSEPIFSTYSDHSVFSSSSGFIVLTTLVEKELHSISFKRDSMKYWNATPNIKSLTSRSLSVVNESGTQELINELNLCSLVHSMPQCSFFKTASKYLIVKDDKLVKEIDTGNKILILPNFNEHNYLLVTSKEETSNLFSFDDFDTPILKNVEILNMEFLRTHGGIWYVGGKKSVLQNTRAIAAFSLEFNRQLKIDENLLGQSIFKDASDFVVTISYIKSSLGTIIDPKTAVVKDAVVGEILAVSHSLNKVISRRDVIIYYFEFDQKSGKYIDTEIEISIKKYKESYLSPNGKFLVLQNETQEYSLMDIETGEETPFFSGKFLAFSKEGNLIYEADNTSSAKIMDPLTFKDITPPNYHHYRFISPDGQLYSQVATKRRYQDKMSNRYIDLSQVTEFRNELDLPYGLDDETKGKIIQNRIAFFEKHKLKLNELGIETHENISSSKLIKTEVFTEIGIVGTNVTAEIHFPIDLAYFNYASFSFDNKYFGYVGKPSQKGLLHIYKLKFDPRAKTIIVEDGYLSRRPGYASWVCGFSKNGYFATYDSTPDTYIIQVDEELFEKNYTEDEIGKGISKNFSGFYSSFKKWSEIKGKNFLCFSPSGNYIALSEQGYEPLTLGGYGHQESGALHIASTCNGTIFDSFLEHGDIIKDDKLKKIVFVAFSEDEKKIMSMSKDGVVIVRTIDLNIFDYDAVDEAIALLPSEPDW